MKKFYATLGLYFCLLVAGFAQTNTKVPTPVPVKVPNTDVTITPPAYFVASDKFSGFIHDGAGATIQISESQGHPYAVMAQAVVDEENLAKQGVKLISKDQVKTQAGKSAYLIVLGFTVKGPTKTFEYERIMLLFGDYNKTVIINANYPVVAKDILFEVLKQSVLTADF